MTIKLPEPVELSSPQDERAVYGYTEAQLKQTMRDVLEQAAQVCEKSAETIWDYHDDNRKQIGTTVCNNLANAIRKMIGEIK